jgi:MFS family permease
MHLVTESNRRWWVVIAMALTTLLMTIDFNGLTVALPTIGRDFGTSTTGLQWTINAYLLALAAPSVAGTTACSRVEASRSTLRVAVRVGIRADGQWVMEVTL